MPKIFKYLGNVGIPKQIQIIIFFSKIFNNDKKHQQLVSANIKRHQQHCKKVNWNFRVLNTNERNLKKKKKRKLIEFT